MNFRLDRAALALAGALSLSAAAHAAEEGEWGKLVDGEGAEETYYACTPCHSEMLVVQQGLTRERWDKLIDWMIEEQGMWEIEQEERDIILDYLSTHYNTDRPNYSVNR